MVKGSVSLQPLRRGRRLLRVGHVGLLIGQDQKRGCAKFTQDCTSGLWSLLQRRGLRPEVKYFAFNIKKKGRDQVLLHHRKTVHISYRVGDKAGVNRGLASYCHFMGQQLCLITVLSQRKLQQTENAIIEKKNWTKEVHNENMSEQ